VQIDGFGWSDRLCTLRSITVDLLCNICNCSSCACCCTSMCQFVVPIVLSCHVLLVYSFSRNCRIGMVVQSRLASSLVMFGLFHSYLLLQWSYPFCTTNYHTPSIVTLGVSMSYSGSSLTLTFDRCKSHLNLAAFVHVQLENESSVFIGFVCSMFLYARFCEVGHAIYLQYRYSCM
jgi:hypothetical protein